MRIVTWNVSFDPWASGPRWARLLQLVEVEAPDVVCFQEAVPCFVRYLCSQSWIAHYVLSDRGDGRSAAPDGEVLY